jgi:tRNA(adenine34) deaminase
MLEALKEAQKAALKNEVPVGAVVVYQGKVVGRGYNKSISSHDPCAHAEIIALQQAAKRLKNYRLAETDMYVTIEPCAMCAGAMVWARVKKLYIGAKDPKTGACGSVFNIINSKKLNHRIKLHQGILETECRRIIQDFFKKKRKK